MVHLCGRPLRNRGRCTLGRETAIQPMVWSADGWLRTADGEGLPYSEVTAPALRGPHFPRAARARRLRPARTLPLDFQWLRSPWPEELFSLTERPGYLRLYGRETLGSLFRQSLVARRQQSHCYSAATVMDFEPDRFQQMAGLVCYYNGSKFHYLYVSHDADLGKHIRVMSCLPDQIQSDVFTPPIAIPSGVAGPSAGGGGLRAPLFRVPAGWAGMAARARTVRRQHPLRRGGTSRNTRTSRAPLWGCVARIWRGRAGRRTSTTSSTASELIVPTPSLTNKAGRRSRKRRPASAPDG